MNVAYFLYIKYTIIYNPDQPTIILMLYKYFKYSSKTLIYSRLNGRQKYLMKVYNHILL